MTLLGVRVTVTVRVQIWLRLGLVLAGAVTLSEVITGGGTKANVYRFLLSSDNDYITFKFIRVSEMILSKLWL